MTPESTAFTLFSVQITWMHLFVIIAVLFAHYILFGLILEAKPRIQICRAFVQAVRTGLEQYGDTLKLLLAETLLLLISLMPLLVLSPLLVKKVPDLWYLALIAYS